MVALTTFALPMALWKVDSIAAILRWESKNMSLSRFFRMALCAVVAMTLCACATLLQNRKDEEKARLQLQLAVDHFNARQYNQAVEATLNALKLAPKMAEAYNHLAVIYMETKRYDKSFESFQKALEIKPNYPEVLNNIGVLLNRQEKYSEAIEYFAKALRDSTYMTPENAYTNMGYSYFRMGKLTTSKAYHQKALDIMPNFCLASKNMGDVYVKEQKYKQAERYFQRAVNQCPLYQEARYKLSLILVKLGDRQLARAELNKLIKQSNEGPYVERSTEVLKYLQ